MKHGGKIFLCSLSLFVLTIGAKAIVSDSASTKNAADESAISATNTVENPYAAIPARNVFDLKDPPPVVTETKTTNPPPANISLVGITTVLSSKRALFLVTQPATPGKPPAKPDSYILSEGQRQGDLEVLEINPKAHTVTIKNDGLTSTITFETNKTILAAGASGAPMPIGSPGMPRPPGMNQPAFNATPGANPYNPGSQPMPGRPTRPSPGYSQATPQGNIGSFQGGGGFTGMSPGVTTGTSIGTGTGASIPLNAFNQTPSTQVGQTPSQAALSLEQETVNLALDYTLNAPKVQNGTYPPLIPIPGLQQLLNGTAGNQPAPPPVPPGVPTPPAGSYSTGTLRR